MKCPNCKRLFVPVALSVFSNVDQYSKAATSVAECCGAVIKVHPVRLYQLEFLPLAVVDDWGNPAAR